MTSDPRAALSALVAALETHLETAAVRRGEDDPAVVEAYERVAEAFTAYDDALLDAYGEVTPLEVYDEDLVDEIDDEDDDEDDFEEEFEDDEDSDDVDDDLEDDDDTDDLEDDDEDETDDPYLGLDDEEFDVDESPRG
ncbi:hypothetical protein GCM10009584_26860 [Ornithinimicrobium humiphilum]|uniref:Primosomal protein n=1 Tax=Ornithinimicrobium humiphilum TaxID=125288 RepID=A0A543KP99_9MICO|nr:hypothetical protein [Ornithinimicrobium humiphilum]TQM96895.1 hypothetical protein FB476_1788 [Ornithinimicrobium humiphilum]